MVKDNPTYHFKLFLTKAKLNIKYKPEKSILSNAIFELSSVIRADLI